MRHLIAIVCLATFGCVTARPAGSDTTPLSVEASGSSWKAKLGDESISRTALFRASGFDDIADKEDQNETYGVYGLAAGLGMSLLTGLLFPYGNQCSDDPADHAPPGSCGAAIFRWFTAGWALTGFIVAGVDLTKPPPELAVARAAAASQNARLLLVKAGVKPGPVTAGQTPQDRQADDEWLLHLATGDDPLARLKIGVKGYPVPHRFARLGLTSDQVDQQLVEVLHRAKPGVKDATEFARFALRQHDRTLEKAAMETLAPEAAGNVDALIALGDLQYARAEYRDALGSYQAAADLAPTALPALEAYGQALVHAGRRHDAIELWVAAIPRMPRDFDRFQLLNLVSNADVAWLHAHADRLPEGLLPAYQDYLDDLRRQNSLSRCLEECDRIEWYGLQETCRSQCYAASGG